uniref:SRCR domain-containing protein n=1 Tax=Chromera velia CCMP2878 TaxID=1169474 RepID=A0A0G4H7J6_9ALVE|eukprot:Cvel_24989.t1-p1 / transcript=Cvel_24989.t1 / gene=Cvel_24989 / organism=Chromera_velia_CCMP2878 / gene_product=hypothetical protein / transcript_product=hypothetical protein / location=Cvel_scaffold2769:20149-21279(+) / protein_length=377 / sequence_SO=supercontig / SO=protein_coding / is_pseudo=false
MFPSRSLTRQTALLVLSVLVPSASATLGTSCCGDNFCCSIMSDNSVSCWGGNSFSAPSGSFQYLTCDGKAGIAVSEDLTISNCFGTSGYGAEGCTTGAKIIDASVGFWGGCRINDGGALTCWGKDTVYGYNSRPTASECSSLGLSDCSAVSTTLSPPSGNFKTVACGGKRAGHFCCAVAADPGPVSCFGAGSESYTPSTSVTNVHQLSCGYNFCCAVLGDGSGSCFGDLDQSDSSGSDLPSTLQGDFAQVACGSYACYFLATDGSMSAYGRVFSRSVGPVPSGTDTTALPSSSGWAAVPTHGGFGHACAVTSGLKMSCWGANYSDQVTDAPSGETANPSGRSVPEALGASSSGSSLKYPGGLALVCWLLPLLVQNVQ